MTVETLVTTWSDTNSSDKGERAWTSSHMVPSRCRPLRSAGLGGRSGQHWRRCSNLPVRPRKGADCAEGIGGHPREAEEVSMCRRRISSVRQPWERACRSWSQGRGRIRSTLSSWPPPVPPDELLCDSPNPEQPNSWHCKVTHYCLATFIEPQRWPCREALHLRHATAWAESLEGALNDQSRSILCRDRCRQKLAEVPKGLDRNAELKRRLQLWKAGEVHDLIR